LKQDDFGFRIGATVQPGTAMTVQGDEPGRSRSGFFCIPGGAMAGYIIDIWKDDELVQSVTGKWSVWNTYGQKTDDRMVTNASATKRNAKIGANVATTL
jgi:hypothetical protein